MATKHQRLAEFLALIDDDIMLADGCEDAFIGVANTLNGFVAVYSTDRLIGKYMKEDMMDFDTAEEYVQFNIIGSYVGEKTPIFIEFIPEEIWNQEEGESE